MSVDLHAGPPTVFVAKPTCQCGNIDTPFDAPRGEDVPQVVVGMASNSRNTVMAPLARVALPGDVEIVGLQALPDLP
jgi:hypothetical protein